MKIPGNQKWKCSLIVRILVNENQILFGIFIWHSNNWRCVYRSVNEHHWKPHLSYGFLFEFNYAGTYLDQVFFLRMNEWGFHCFQPFWERSNGYSLRAYPYCSQGLPQGMLLCGTDLYRVQWGFEPLLRNKGNKSWILRAINTMSKMEQTVVPVGWKRAIVNNKVVYMR